MSLLPRQPSPVRLREGPVGARAIVQRSTFLGGGVGLGRRALALSPLRRPVAASDRAGIGQSDALLRRLTGTLQDGARAANLVGATANVRSSGNASSSTNYNKASAALFQPPTVSFQSPPRAFFSRQSELSQRHGSDIGGPFAAGLHGRRAGASSFAPPTAPVGPRVFGSVLGNVVRSPGQLQSRPSPPRFGDVFKVGPTPAATGAGPGFAIETRAIDQSHHDRVAAVATGVDLAHPVVAPETANSQGAADAAATFAHVVGGVPHMERSFPVPDTRPVGGGFRSPASMMRAWTHAGALGLEFEIGTTQGNGGLGRRSSLEGIEATVDARHLGNDSENQHRTTATAPSNVASAVTPATDDTGADIKLNHCHGAGDQFEAETGPCDAGRRDGSTRVRMPIYVNAVGPAAMLGTVVVKNGITVADVAAIVDRELSAGGAVPSWKLAVCGDMPVDPRGVDGGIALHDIVAALHPSRRPFFLVTLW